VGLRCLSVRVYVCSSIHKASSILVKFGMSYRSMSDARWYAVWPDLRSRSRALHSWKFFHFQMISPPPFTMGASNWTLIVKLGTTSKFDWARFLIFVLVVVLNLAETSVVKSRRSVPYRANLLSMIAMLLLLLAHDISKAEVKMNLCCDTKT